MSSEHTEEERALRERLERSEQGLKDLESQLDAVDAELEALAARDHQYALLAKLCGSLEELDGLGAAELFWGQQGADERHVEHLRGARARIDSFAAEIAAAKERRFRIVEKMDDRNDELDDIHYELSDVMEREEKRRGEWLVEREPDPLPRRTQVLPWARGFEEDMRFRRSLGGSMAASVALAMLVSMVALPIVERTNTMDVLPERVAKLVRRERLPPPPPAIAEPIIPEELPEPEPEPEPELADEPVPQTTEQPVVADVEQPEPKQQVRSKGILAFRDSFASRADLRPTAQLGSQARVRTAGDTAIGRPERMMVTTTAPGSSGGINLASLSRDVGAGGQAIEGVQVTRVASSIGGGEGPDRPLSGGMAAGRTDEEIQIVFDRYKAALYRLYNRELRKDPTLRGQLVLRLTIEPDGSVSLCQLHNSDMDAPTLAQQVVDRVSTFDFGAKEDVAAITIIYPIDFLPAA